MKDKLIGVYQIGSEQVQLVFRAEDGGGSFTWMPEKGALARIRIGYSQHWDDMISILLHEAFEMQMARIRCRWSRSPDWGNDNGDYLFVMHHSEFSDVCGRVAIFTAKCLPDLKAHWTKMRKKIRIETL